MKIKNILKHFNKICIHKFWVFYYCCKAGIPLRGLIHDLSKFSPTEFFESVKYYNGTKSPIDICKSENGYSMAWQHHKGRNFHHYEAWTDNYDKGTTSVPMPYKYAVEMICDYLGAGRAYMGKKFSYEKEYEWWQNKRKISISMNIRTKDFVDLVFENICTDKGYKVFFKEDTLRYFYYLTNNRR